jgi:cholest-4-en-3-one 26-monooxygenase
MAALDEIDITSMPRYLQHGYPWADWDRLRAEAAVYWYEGRPRFSPFWAITRYDDVRYVSSHPELFSNAGVIRLDTENGIARQAAYKAKRAERHGWDPDVPLDMLYTDRPEHLDLRSIAVRRFTPGAMRRLAGHVDELARRFVESFVHAGRTAAPEPVDIVENLSVGVPIATICGLLGVPSEDWPTIRRWSDQTLLTPDLNHPDVRPGETAADVRRRAGLEYHAYRQRLIDEARARPVRDDSFDIVSLLAHATIDGRPLDDQRLHGYIELLVGGGNETTRNTITGGVQILLEQPDQAAVLAADPRGLAETATEEILRWVSPVIQFARTATTNVEIRGQRIHAATRSSCGTRQPTATSASSPTPTASTCAATPTPTSPSATASTSASARTLPAGSCAPSSGPSPRTSPTSASPAPRSACPASTSAPSPSSSSGGRTHDLCDGGACTLSCDRGGRHATAGRVSAHPRLPCSSGRRIQCCSCAAAAGRRQLATARTGAWPLTATETSRAVSTAGWSSASRDWW